MRTEVAARSLLHALPTGVPRGSLAVRLLICQQEVESVEKHDNAERAETAESFCEEFSAISADSALNVGVFQQAANPRQTATLAARPHRFGRRETSAPSSRWSATLRRD